MILLYILLALLVFGILIFIHELGHFIAARLCGVKILEFSIGMGPKLFSKRSKKTDTLYSLRLFPIGGYVNMLGENGMEAVQGDNGIDQEGSENIFLNSTIDSKNVEPEPAPIDPELEKQAYCNQSVWKRILISLAGPLMNVVLGFVLMFFIVLASGHEAVATTQVGAFYTEYFSETEQYGFQKGDVLDVCRYSGDDAAEWKTVRSLEWLLTECKGAPTNALDVVVNRYNENGEVVQVKLENVPFTQAFIDEGFVQSLSAQQLQLGDVIKKVNSTSVHSANELYYEIMNQGHKPITFTVERNGEKIELAPIQLPTFVESNTTFGNMDFRVYGIKEADFNFGVILKHAWFRSVSTVKMVFDSLGGLFSGRYGVEAVSGPVGITKTISDVAQTGFLNLIYFVTVISINLGVMNLLPFPALDGGHLLLYLIEIVRRKPVKKEVEGIINFIGLIILLAFIVLISIKDIIAL